MPDSPASPVVRRSRAARPPMLLRCSTDIEGRLTDVGDEWVRFCGRDPATLIAEGWVGLVHRDDLERLSDAIARAASAGRERCELRIRNARGEYRWMRCRLAPVAGAPSEGVRLRLLDVTVRRSAAGTRPDHRPDRAQMAALRVLSERANERAREALVRSTASYAVLEGFIEHAPLGMALLDTQFRFLRVNDTLADMNEEPSAAMLGRTVAEVVPGVWTQVEPFLRTLLATREAQRFEFHTLSGNRNFLCYVFPVEGTDGNLMCIGASVVDITERKRMEDELQRANAVKDEFLGLVSHELRTPLTTIMSNARFLGRYSQLPDEAKELIDDLAEGAQRMRDVIENMLVLARLEHDELEVEPVALGPVVRRAVARRANESHQVHIDLPEDLSPVEASETAIGMVLDNLLSNAMKYSPAGAGIRVHVEGRPDEVVVRVLDRGAGLDAEETERLFDRFYRSQRFRNFIGGAGLGLTVCKRVVEEMGGTIWAAPREGGGSEFGFSVPTSRE
ncbi:MAG: PAS domain-containing protein [Dehalococcoidia bacterium]|nr:PAS domain-containing protein [Dehalococcoidia bacterium]